MRNRERGPHNPVFERAKPTPREQMVEKNQEQIRNEYIKKIVGKHRELGISTRFVLDTFGGSSSPRDVAILLDLDKARDLESGRLKTVPQIADHSRSLLMQTNGDVCAIVFFDPERKGLDIRNLSEQSKVARELWKSGVMLEIHRDPLEQPPSSKREGSRNRKPQD